MAQSDLTIQNQSFPSFRADLNDALSALNSMQSGTNRPASAVAGTLWLDITNPTNPTIKFFDGTDDIQFATVDYSANTVNFFDSSISITGISTTATGTVLTITDSANTTTVNLIIDNQQEIRFRETTANGTNYVALKAPASLASDLTFTLPATDGTAGQVLTTNGSGVLSFATSSAGIGFKPEPRFANFTAVAGEGYFCDTLGLERTVYVQSVGGSNKFFIGGVQQPTLELVEGNTYVFNYPSAHPFAFSETSDGTHGGGVEYTTGVTRDGVNYTLTYVVPTSAPTLYYYCSTHSGMGGQANTPATQPSFTVTLPATPSAGDQVQLVDYAGTFDTNALTINPNGEDIEGGASGLQLKGEREGVILTYIDSTQGWIATSGINEGTDALEPITYSIDFLVVAGGGGSGAGSTTAGGGAGGFRTSTQTVGIGTAITVTVGAGGTGSPNDSTRGGEGGNSSISGSGLTTITSAGGGGGGVNLVQEPGGSGGSGGGGAGTGAGVFPGGVGNTPNTSPSQGNNGGAGGNFPPAYGSGGGGGASQNGFTGTSSAGGNGGNGSASSITGSSVPYAGGGGGNAGSAFTMGLGGSGGGGNAVAASTGVAGSANTGGGAGGGHTPGNPSGALGGSGIVILSMPLANFSGTVTGSPTESDDGTTKVLQFTGSGSYTT